MSTGAVYAACTTSGTQCEVSDGSTQTPTGLNFSATGAGYDYNSSSYPIVAPNGALVVIDGSTIIGTNLNITATGANEYAGLVGENSTLELKDSTIEADQGIFVGDIRKYPDYIYGAPNSSFKMEDGSITTVGTALHLGGNSYGGVSAELENVDITTTGLRVAVHMNSYKNSSFSMTGGSITAYQLGGIEAGGYNQSIYINNVEINTGGTYGIGVATTNGYGNIVDIIDSKIIHNSNNANGSVNFTGGNLLIDNTIVKNIGEGSAVSIGNSTVDSNLKAIDFEFEANFWGGTTLAIGRNGHAHLTDGKITANGDYNYSWPAGSYAIRIFPGSSGSASLTTERVDVEALGERSIGLYTIGKTAQALLKDSSIKALGVNAIAALVDRGSHVEFDNTSVQSLNNTTAGVGIQVMNGSSVTLKNNSEVITSGAASPALFFFDGTATDIINVDNSLVRAQDYFAVRAAGGTDFLNVSGDSTVRGDKLVLAGNATVNSTLYGAKLTINADNSKLFGLSELTSLSTLTMNLDNHALWSIHPSNTGATTSHVSFVNLDNESGIEFDQNGTGLFQELWVGKGDLGGAITVWTGGNDASITFNTYLNEGGDWANQSTDRLYIEGDVSGQTLVNINQIIGNPGGWTSPTNAYANDEGISLIQVSGQAAQDSFTLQGGYVTMGGLPYAYDIYAYGPGSSNGAADPGQQKVSGTDYWDFRLQSLLATTTGPGRTAVWDVAPQLANYIVAPTALFHFGNQEIGNLRQRLGDIRVRVTRQSEILPLSFAAKGAESDAFRSFDDEAQASQSQLSSRAEFFMRGFGGTATYHDKKAAYHYNADIQHSALQVGGNLYGVEASNAQILFGLSGSYGNVRFHPQRDGVDKTSLNVWTISPYMTWAHDNGSYLDVIVSYGGFKGSVATPARGRTALLQGRLMAASMEVGRSFDLPFSGLTLEPQAQIIYQRLKFDDTFDVDNFPVELGSLDQWTFRAGALLQKTYLKDNGNTIKLYGKLNLIHSEQKHNKLWFGDVFDAGKPGTHLEVGFGANAALSKSAALYGEVNWKERVGKAGSSGLSLNGGFKLKF